MREITDYARELADVIVRMAEQSPDALTVLKWKEVYEKLEAAIDRCENVANIIESTEDDPPAAEPISPFAVFGEGPTLQAIPCLRLLEMKFPLVDFLISSDIGERPEAPRRASRSSAMGRANYRLHVEEISLWQFAFLRACERPTSSYPAVQVAALESGRDPGQALAEVALWLPVAIELGFLRGVPNSAAFEVQRDNQTPKN